MCHGYLNFRAIRLSLALHSGRFSPLCILRVRLRNERATACTPAKHAVSRQQLLVSRIQSHRQMMYKLDQVFLGQDHLQVGCELIFGHTYQTTNSKQVW